MHHVFCFNWLPAGNRSPHKHGLLAACSAAIMAPMIGANYLRDCRSGSRQWPAPTLSCQQKLQQPHPPGWVLNVSVLCAVSSCIHMNDSADRARQALSCSCSSTRTRRPMHRTQHAVQHGQPVCQQQHLEQPSCPQAATPIHTCQHCVGRDQHQTMLSANTIRA